MDRPKDRWTFNKNYRLNGKKNVPKKCNVVIEKLPIFQKILNLSEIYK